MVKNLPPVRETWFDPWFGKLPWRRHQYNPLQYSCLENPHGQRSQEGYSLWGHKGSDTTERLRIIIVSNTKLDTLLLEEKKIKSE